MPYRVVFTPEAVSHLSALYDRVEADKSAAVASRYTESILGFCEGLSTFPHRGIAREDIRPGLRITNYRKNTVIAFSVMHDVVAIIGLFYGGRDYEVALKDG